MKIFLAPFFLAALLNIFVGSPTYRTIGSFTDHLSHMSTVFLFLEKGFDVYRKKTSELCPIKDSEEVRAFNETWMISPEDRQNTCQVRPGGRVLFINWPQMARPYPVGELVWFAPAAMLYAATESVAGVAQFLVWQMLLAAGIGMAMFTDTEFFRTASRRFEKYWCAGMAGVVLSSISGMGFFDGLAFWLLIASVLYSFGDRQVSLERAICFFAFACLFHYRAIWYFPICLFAGWKLYSLNRRFWARPLVYVSISLLVLSATTLIMGLQSIRELGIENPLLRTPVPAMLHLAFMLIVSASLLFRDRNILGLTCLVMCFLFSALTPLAQSWYILFWIPLLVIALRPDRSGFTFWPLVLLVAVLDQNIYGFFLFSGGAFPGGLLQLFYPRS